VARSRFRKLLREARKRAELSQPKLAKKVDVDKSYISKLETGVFPPPSREVVLKLAAALNIREKTRRWPDFLLAAGVTSEEDMEGFELVEVEDDEAEAEEEEGRPISLIAHPAIALPDSLFRTSRKEFNDLIDSAHLTAEEDEQVFAAFVEIAKPILALIKTQRKMRKEGS
jgi:transcriptional regulator with XRE-family HTH domain